MMIYYTGFNNNMCKHETETFICDGNSPEQNEYSEHYDSDSDTNKGFSEEKPLSYDSSVREQRLQCDELKPVNTTTKNTSKRIKSKRKKPLTINSKPPAIKKAAQSNSYTHNSVVDRWEAAQLALADANSQNVLLQRQLEECRVELRTVQRQCKMQSARLNKAIGQEADMPQIVDRLTADIRSLQIRLRDKTSQYDAGQRRISELQHRIYVLEKERDEFQAQTASEEPSQRRYGPSLEELQSELQAEKKKNSTLTHQLELATRSHKHQISLAHEQIRQLRQSCRDLELQLNERTLLLQEKIKLLELQNIYSLRLPKNIPTHLPPTEIRHTRSLDSQNGLVVKEDSYLPAIDKGHMQSQSRHRPVDRNQRKISVSLGRMRGKRHIQSNDIPNLTNTDPDSTHVSELTKPDFQESHLNETKLNDLDNFNTVTKQDILLARDSPEQLVQQIHPTDPNSTKFNQIEGDKKTGEHQTADSNIRKNEITSLDQVSYIGDESTLQMNQARDDIQRFAVSNGKNTMLKELKTTPDSDKVREWHAQLNRLSDQDEQFRLIASQHHRPIDITADLQDPHTSGSSQTSPSAFNKQEAKEIHEEKIQLFQTMDALEQSLSQENDSLLGSTLQDRTELSEDCGGFNTKREQELWDELFGSEKKCNQDPVETNATIYRGHAGLMAKTSHGEAMHKVSSQPSPAQSNTHVSLPRVEEFRSSMSKSPSNYSPVNNLSATVGDAFDRPTAPRRADFRAFDEDQEADSEFEELHA